MRLFIPLPSDAVYCPCVGGGERCRVAPIVCSGLLKERPYVCPIKEVDNGQHFPCSSSVDLVLQAIASLKKVIEEEGKNKNYE